jgi:L,D-transpeptidase-like protein
VSRIALPDILSKIGLGAHRPRFDVASAAAQSVLPQMTVVNLVAETGSGAGTTIHHDQYAPDRRWPLPPLDPLSRFFRRHSVIVAALALLLVGSAAIRVAADYWTAKHIAPVASVKVAKLPARPIAGFNITVPAAELQAKLQSITSQPATLTVGGFSEPINGDIIKGWLQITANKQKTEYYIHVNEAAIASSLTKEAGEYARSPVNQVTATEDGVSRVVVGGRDGRALSDTKTLKTQAGQTAKSVMNGAGLQFSTPMATVPFQSVTPAAFDKLLVSDITTKKMWAFQNGQQVNSWLISAGAPATPTPVGEFHVYAKFSVQDMRGTNPNGTPYFQPHVRWVNYFYQGSAVHGVYWHPLSWFGAINSSHGCIGLPENEAQWIYNWAPIGTTVIVHT